MSERSGDAQPTIPLTVNADGTTRAHTHTDPSPVGFALSPTVEPSRPGQAGAYRLVRRHATGGVGEVYVGLDEPLHRQVAVKKIRPELADRDDVRARFLVEAEVTGRLEHPGVVPVYTLGHDDQGRPY